MKTQTLIGLVPVALIGFALVFSACQPTDEPVGDVSECDDGFDINFDPTVAADNTCNNTGCSIKKANQAFTVRVCAAHMAGAQQAAGQRVNQRRAATQLIETACAPFSCPTPNPCTTAGQTCQAQNPTLKTVQTFGAPTCVNTTQQGNCAAGQTEWDCTYAKATVSGSKQCKCS